MMIRISFCLFMTVFFGATSVLCAQDRCVSYKLVPQTTYRTNPVTVSHLVNETVMEPKQITTYKPVWTRENRERRSVVLKPVVKTSHREERYLVRRPIIETKYKEQKIEETSYETVTEMREQRWLVEKPVVETQYREEQVVVRKPVTKTLIQTENVTTLKPVTVRETQYMAGATVRNDLVLETGRNRLQWLRPGTYVDPLSGYAGYKRRGLHWVRNQQLALRPSLEPALIPYQVDRTTYQPETVRVQKPIQVTEYVDQYETRKVPVQVSKTSREILTTKTPVTVKKPVTTIRTERVPYKEVKYRQEILVRRVPVTETTYQRVEQVEPYEVEVCKWVAETKEIKVPRTITRRVNYSINQLVPENVVMRVPVDAWGNVVGEPTQIPQTQTAYRYPVAERILAAPVVETYKPIPGKSSGSTVVGEPIVVRKLRADEYLDENPDSVLVPETETNADKPQSKTTVVRRPTLIDSNEEDSSDADVESNGSVLDSDQSPKLEPAETGLQIEENDSADIDSRPSGDNHSTEQDDIPLDGVN